MDEGTPGPDTPSRAFGELLRGYRLAAGLTQEELAERSGLSVRSLGDMERGHTSRPFARSVRLAADALELGQADRARLLTARNADSASRPENDAAPAPSRPALPRQLPAPVRSFSGREHELEALAGLLDQDGGQPREAVLISAIGGTAGVGKTALAVQSAHRVARQYPDGQLYADLRGYGPGPPADAAEILAAFLRALGVAGRDIPAAQDERAACFRSQLAGRRMLLLLDNARDVEQVRPLLPGTAGCSAIVTSRDSLAGLVARDGAVRLELDLLPLRDAVMLLRTLIGGRVDAEPAAAAALAEQCARLPLALRITAEMAAARPAAGLAGLASDLADRQRRLEILTAGGDPRTAVRAVFSWSYRELSRPAARLFRLTGLHPGRTITVPAAASLASLSPGQARRRLDELTRAHLLTEQAPGRFGCHDLLRAYAVELAAGSGPARRTARGRLLDYYLHTATAADRLLYPLRRPITLVAPRAGVIPAPLADHGQALAWLDAEHQDLLAAVRLAAGHGYDEHAWQLSYSLETFFYRRGHWHDWAVTQQLALTAAYRVGDRLAQALAHTGAANAQIEAGQPASGLPHLAMALRLREEAGDTYGQARVLLYASRALECLGRYPEALANSREALRLAQAAGGPPARALQAQALNQVGWELARIGRYPQALRYCQRSIALIRQLGSKHQEPGVLDSLAYIYRHLGRYGEAAEYYRRAAELHDEIGNRSLKAGTLDHAGDAFQAAGDLAAACRAWEQALTILDELRHPDADQVRAKLAGPAGRRAPAGLSNFPG